MPAKNVEKNYAVNAIYHAYNRGVEKRKIFLDDQDYRVFLHLLKYYLSSDGKNSPHPITSTGKLNLIRPRPLKNFNHQEVQLIAYCLMPNHYHLLLKQTTLDGMTKLLRRVATTYSLYFNRRYKRVGYLFQGRYKATRVEDQAELLYLSRYIHLNPKGCGIGGMTRGMTRCDLVIYPYSSYPYFLRLKRADWLHPEAVLELVKNYQGFVEESPEDKEADLW